MREDCSSLRKRVTSATLSRVIPQSTGRRGRHSFRVLTTLDNPYRYVGQLGYYTHWMDSSLTDLLHLGVRFYEPDVGRFSTLDEVQWEERNRYAYSDDRPTSTVDPDGRFPICIRAYTHNRGSFRVDSSCKRKLRMWIVPESKANPAFTPPTSGNWYRADGFSIDRTMYKVDGSTSTTVYCESGWIQFETSVNLLAYILGKGGPRIVPWNEFKNSPPRRAGELVQ